MGRQSAQRLPLAEDGVVLQGQTRTDANFRFDHALMERDLGPLVRGAVTTLQVNVGKLCNQACHHCHVEAGPKRTEIMSQAVAKSRGLRWGRSVTLAHQR